jgi:hypothetical protein
MMKTTLWLVALAALLSACSEAPQTLGTRSGKQDEVPYSGIGKGFTDASWKQRDQTSWASHLKARAQYGQNDYARMN